MKKKLLCFALAALLLLSLAGCGASGNSAASSADRAPAVEQERAASQNGDAGGGLSDGQRAFGLEPGAFDADKIIYSAYAEIETLDFDGALQKVRALIDRHGGFLESSSVTGSNHYAGGSTAGRGASFTIRIPRASFSAVMDSLGDLGNVPYSNTEAESVTTQYRDTESRLLACQTQETRLLDMLAQAATVEEMLQVEAQLSEVQYRIESLTTQLQGWDSLMQYSTLSLDITEVSGYTEGLAATTSYWGRMGAGFSRSLKNVGSFFKNVFLWLVVQLPVLVLLAALCAVVLLAVRRIRKTRGGKPALLLRRKGKKEKPKETDGTEHGGKGP